MCMCQNFKGYKILKMSNVSHWNKKVKPKLEINMNNVSAYLNMTPFIIDNTLHPIMKLFL